MPTLFRISVHFLQPYCHARGEGDVPEWPPSPLRLFQALVSAAAARWNERQSLTFAGPALRWFETLAPPSIHCAIGHPATMPYRLYVPDNIADKVAAVWLRGGDASIADYRTEKDIRPTSLEGAAVAYVFSIDQLTSDVAQFLDVIRLAARSITHLGWGTDMVAADADLIEAVDAAVLPGERWVATRGNGTPMRCPQGGSLNDLLVRHQAFLNRIETDEDGEQTFIPVPPIRAFLPLVYRRITDSPRRSHVVFKLVDENGDTYRHPHASLIQIAGMVRHLAIDAMKRNPPPGLNNPAAWVERYVAGHQNPSDKEVDLPHEQLSYLPLPSVGHQHTDPGVRRVMIAGPAGDDAILEHLARQLSGMRLIAERPKDLRGHSVFLSCTKGDNIEHFYADPSNRWASFTPVILPGHDDHKPEKTRRLILSALRQSGIDQPCEFEWSAFSHFLKSLSAHKYNQHKQLTGYFRPDHLRNLTAVHLRIRFGERADHNDPDSQFKPRDFRGPLAIGAGRHCGLGIFAGVKA